MVLFVDIVMPFMFDNIIYLIAAPFFVPCRFGGPHFRSRWALRFAARSSAERRASRNSTNSFARPPAIAIQCKYICIYTNTPCYRAHARKNQTVSKELKWYLSATKMTSFHCGARFVFVCDRITPKL